MPKDEKKQTNSNSLTHKPREKSERVVVDEIFEDGLARLLRAKRVAKHPDNDLGIHTWDEEREDFIEACKVGCIEQQHPRYMISLTLRNL